MNVLRAAQRGFFQNERKSKLGSDCIVLDRLECVVLRWFVSSQRPRGPKINP